MDLNEIKKLIKIVETSDIEELEIQEDKFQIRVTKGKGMYQMPMMPAMPAAPQQIVAPPPAAAPDAPKEAARSANVIEVLSPMVGTFYRAPSPDSKPYVEIGDTIQPGKTLCIVEAMKLMNEIEAEVSGKIVEILVENAQAVEYNQPLFLVEKS